jgi:trafficking protein particle complex subunit 2
MNEEDIKFQYISHVSLDIIEETISSRNSSEPYLGLLFPSESFKIYGYITNTKLKIILICNDDEVIDKELKPVNI